MPLMLKRDAGPTLQCVLPLPGKKSFVDQIAMARQSRRGADKQALRMTWQTGIKVLVTVAVLAAFFTVAIEISTRQLEALLAASGYWSPILFSLLMIAGILISPIPTSPLTLVAPKLFGLWGGLALVLVSATAGATIAFFIGRKLGGRFFQKFPQYRRFQHFLGSDATAFAIFLLRLPPSPTFDMVSYLAGLTEIAVWPFVLATFFGMIPVTATLCLIGSVTPTVWLVPALAGLLLFSVVRWTRARQTRP